MSELNPGETNTETAAQVPEKPEPIDLGAALNDSTVKSTVVLFNFKKNRQTGVRRPSFYLTLPFVTFEGIVAAASDDSTPEAQALATKVQNYIVDLANEAVIGAAREQINDETNPVNSQEDLKLADLTLIGLATRPPSERRGAGISKEQWEEFSKDYVTTMVQAGKTEAQAKNAAKMFVAKYGPYRAQKKVLVKLLENLAVYVASTPNLEEFAEVVEFLKSRGEGYLNTSEEDLLQNL